MSARSPLQSLAAVQRNEIAATHDLVYICFSSIYHTFYIVSSFRYEGFHKDGGCHKGAGSKTLVPKHKIGKDNVQAVNADQAIRMLMNLVMLSVLQCQALHTPQSSI
jgi:hypothetical protein